MSETTSVTPAAGDGTPTPTGDVTAENPTPPTPDTGDVTGGNDKGAGSEAAKYRTRLREAEQQRDALAERLTSAQRAVVEASVSGKLASVADFWTHTELSTLLDDDGNVDGDKISAAVTELLERAPHYARRQQTLPNAAEVQGGVVIEGGGDKALTWSDVLNGQ